MSRDSPGLSSEGLVPLRSLADWRPVSIPLVNSAEDPGKADVRGSEQPRKEAISDSLHIRTRSSSPRPDPFDDVLTAPDTEEVTDGSASIAICLLPDIIARHRPRFSALSTLLLEEAIVDRVWECST